MGKFGSHYEFHRWLGNAKRPPGGNLVLSMVRGRAIFKGYFFQTVTDSRVSFSQFVDISRNYGCPFQGIFHNFRNYGPHFHSIYGIMTLKSTRIYGIMGTNFSGKMARPRQMIGRDTPPPRASDGKWPLLWH